MLFLEYFIELTSAFDLSFPTSAITDYSSIQCIYDNLTEVTIAFWMITTDQENYGTVLSYATHLHDNALTIMDYGG